MEHLILRGIAQKLKIDSWCSDNFVTKYRSLDEIDLGDLVLYDPATKTGAIVYNWGSVLVGKLGDLAGRFNYPNKMSLDCFSSKS